MVVDIFSIVPAIYLQIFSIVMILFVIAGMLYDFIGGSKLEYTVRDRKARGAKGFDMGAALKAIFIDIATSAQFSKCSIQRRASHLLMMWGFIISVIVLFIETFVTSLVSTLSTYYYSLQTLLLICWFMLLAGALWFLPQRANVRVDGDPVYKLRRADIFVLNVMVYAVLGVALLWSMNSGLLIASKVILGAFLSSIAFLSISVPWTKFPHMFYKAGLIIQDKMEKGKVESRLPGE
ncbi:MAG: hypothetical protein ACP5NC_06105 [Nitrososphaeria archaeon]